MPARSGPPSWTQKESLLRSQTLLELRGGDANSAASNRSARGTPPWVGWSCPASGSRGRTGSPHPSRDRREAGDGIALLLKAPTAAQSRDAAGCGNRYDGDGHGPTRARSDSPTGRAPRGLRGTSWPGRKSGGPASDESKSRGGRRGSTHAARALRSSTAIESGLVRQLVSAWRAEEEAKVQDGDLFADQLPTASCPRAGSDGARQEARPETESRGGRTYPRSRKGMV
jgi:hypothetical protein